MRFKVEKLPVVQTEIQALEQNQQEMLMQDYNLIETQGIEFVKIKPDRNKFYELKTNELKSSFKYTKNHCSRKWLIVKQTQKTPKEVIKITETLEGSVAMKCVFVRDEEEYVCKKRASEVTSQETVISEEEYMRAAGLLAYQKEYGHGGARKNAGRKRKFGSPLQFQIRVTKEEKDFITYARKHHLDYSSLMETQPHHTTSFGEWGEMAELPAERYCAF